MGKRVDLPDAEMARRYEAGESTWALARAYSVSHETIGRRLRAAGVKMRPRGGPQGNRYGRGKAGWHKRGGPLWVSKDGYLATHGREGKQCHIHRGCWEAYQGPIPKGHVVHHIDGDQTNNAIGNLACMTNGEHVGLHNTTREVAGGGLAMVANSGGAGGVLRRIRRRTGVGSDTPDTEEAGR